MNNNITAITTYSADGKAALEQMAKDKDVYMNFLKFQGKVFKQDTNVALEFFVQNPNAQFIATESQWERLNYHLKIDAEAIVFMTQKGSFVSFYDFSQIVEENAPSIWHIGASNVKEIKQELNIAENTKLIDGVIQETMYEQDILDAMIALKISPEKQKEFSQAYVNAAQLILAGRFEIGGNTFGVQADVNFYASLPLEQRLPFLKRVSASSRNSLLKVENTINKINERKRNNEIRRMDQADRSAERNNTGNRVPGNTEGNAEERTGIIKSAEEGQRAGMGNSSENQGTGNQSMVTGVQVQNDNGQGILVQAESSEWNIRSEHSAGGTVSGRGTAGDLWQPMDGLHGRKLSGSGELAETGMQVSESSEVSGQGSIRVQGAAGQTVRGTESSSGKPELRGTGSMGTEPSILHGWNGNEGESVSTENSRVIDKLNAGFQINNQTSASAEKVDAVSFEELTEKIKEKEKEAQQLLEKHDYDSMSAVTEELKSLKRQLSEQDSVLKNTTEDITVKSIGIRYHIHNIINPYSETYGKTDVQIWTHRSLDDYAYCGFGKVCDNYDDAMKFIEEDIKERLELKNTHPQIKDTAVQKSDKQINKGYSEDVLYEDINTNYHIHEDYEHNFLVQVQKRSEIANTEVLSFTGKKEWFDSLEEAKQYIYNDAEMIRQGNTEKVDTYINSEENLLEKAKELIREYIFDEFDIEEDFKNLHNIGLAFTTIGDDEVPIQVSVDLIDCSIFKTLGEVEVLREKYSSLEELIDNELYGLNFSDLISTEFEELKKYYFNDTNLQFDVLTIDNTIVVTTDSFDENSDISDYFDDLSQYGETIDVEHEHVLLTFAELNNDDNSAEYPSEEQINFIREYYEDIFQMSEYSCTQRKTLLINNPDFDINTEKIKEKYLDSQKPEKSEDYLLPKNKKQVLTAILQAHSDNKGWTDISDIEELIDEDFSMFNVASIDMFGHYKEIDLSPAQLAGIYYHTVNNPVGYDYAMDRYNTFLQIAKQRALEEPETIDLKAEDNDNIEIIEKDFSEQAEKTDNSDDEFVQMSMFDVGNSDIKQPKTIMFDDINISELIDKSIMIGTGFEDGKFRIEEYYLRDHPNNNEFGKFLKNEYGVGGRSVNEYPPVNFEQHEASGIIFQFDNNTAYTVKWNIVAQHIAMAIDAGQYITDDDIKNRINNTIHHLNEKYPRYNRDDLLNVLKRNNVTTYMIYQLKSAEEIPGNHDIKFETLDSLKKHDFAIPNIELYDEKWVDNYDEVAGSSDEEKLDTIFADFNRNHPYGFTGHSLSISDVILVSTSDDKKTAYYVNDIGFADITDEFLSIEKENERTVDDITVGDKYKYNHAEYTVTALEGLYPNEIVMTKTEEISGKSYEVTSNIDKNKLHDNGTFLGNNNSSLEVTVEESKTEPSKTARKRPSNAEKLYKKFSEVFPDIASGEHEHERYGQLSETGGFEPLSVEHLDGNWYGLMFFYEQNGDLMRDPDFTFTLDHENKTLTIQEYQLDGAIYGTIYERVFDEEGQADKRLLRELEENFSQILENIPIVGRALTSYTDKNGHETILDSKEIVDVEHMTKAVEETVENDIIPEEEEPVMHNIEYGTTAYNKLYDNITAIEEMARLRKWKAEGRNPLYRESDRRFKYIPTRQESVDRLIRYCGWGGLPQIFDESNNQRDLVYNRKRLKTILTEEEYNSCRASTLNAHYTPQIIIDAMYDAIKNMDLPRDSRILEPSCGTGNFITRLPASLGNKEVVGIELDMVTAEICSWINYGNENIKIINSPFENVKLENDSFDLAIGNVPFGDYKLNDPDYVQDWKIHDAFFRRALDKVAPGGVVAFITSSGTLDKKNPKVREFLATRADLIGAIRLPNNAFSSAGTKVTSDIVFLQKRAFPLHMHERKPDWCYVAQNEDGLLINAYFVKNPSMILGKMEKTNHFDMLTCTPFEGTDLKQQLSAAIKNLNAKITITKRNNHIKGLTGSIEAWGSDYSFHLKDDTLYYRQGSKMSKVECSDSEKKKIVQLCGIRTAARELIELQQTSITDNELLPYRTKLNDLYDNFYSTYGSIQKNADKYIKKDADYPLLAGLESSNGEKADIFYRRTVNAAIEITSAETVEEALQISLDHKGKIDINYMSALLVNTFDDTVDDKDIKGIIGQELIEKGLAFADPEKKVADDEFADLVERAEYLSGNVRMKLTLAEQYAQLSEKNQIKYEKNIEALKEVVPEDILADEITVHMGCTWIDADDYTAFLNHLSGRTASDSLNIAVSYISVTNQFDIMNAGVKSNLNVNETSVYGTNDISMYKIAEKILNQRRIEVKYEAVSPYDPDRTIMKTDAKATKLAQEKAAKIKKEFQKWIFADPARKDKYERRYNDIFNSLVGREYDGSHLEFPGMLSDFKLRKHQVDCIARSIYGGNTLAAHVVGAGKSAVIMASVMKKKQMGLINKACVVVPKALTEQTALEWRKLYPDAKILTVTNDDLATEENRNLFTARIATGSYDAVVVSKEQFEKMPMSKQYRVEYLQKELDKIDDILREQQKNGDNRSTIKQIETAKKRIAERIEKIQNPKSKTKEKDKLLEFEQLGFDYLVVDEAHEYKNGFVVTKMNNVAGVTTRPSGRAEDMQMKTDYFNEQLGQGHILFATGTPVSNSMTELYVMTRYLRPDILRAQGLDNFDNWAATFGEVVTKNQQGADGRLKMKTKFAHFSNLPELMATYKEFADIQSAEKLELPRPALKTGKIQIIKAEATPEQKTYVRELADRAEQIESGAVDPTVDNHLKITGEARLLGLGNMVVKSLYRKSNRPVPEDFVDVKNSKVDMCIEKVAELYQQTNNTKGVQIIFSDIAVHGDDKNFSVYDYIRDELVNNHGIPAEEIIYAPKSDAKNREDIFRDINNSKYRVVLASTNTLGTGANIQNNLYALHHIDIPWKPSDFTQREGRILRQGNQNKEVEIFNYITEGTLDSYLYQTVTDKARFIAQLMDNKAPARVSEDCDEKVLTFGELQAAAEGNPDFRKRIELSNEIAELKMFKQEYDHETSKTKQTIETLPQFISKLESSLEQVKTDLRSADYITHNGLTIKTPDNKLLSEKKEINEYLLGIAKKVKSHAVSSASFKAGDFSVSVYIQGDGLGGYGVKYGVSNNYSYTCDAGATDGDDNYTRLSNLFKFGVNKVKNGMTNNLESHKQNLQQAIDRAATPYDRLEELNAKIEEFEKLERKLSSLSEQQDDVYDAESAEMENKSVQSKQVDVDPDDYEPVEENTTQENTPETNTPPVSYGPTR